MRRMAARACDTRSLSRPRPGFPSTAAQPVHDLSISNGCRTAIHESVEPLRGMRVTKSTMLVRKSAEPNVHSLTCADHRHDTIPARHRPKSARVAASAFISGC